MARREAIWGAAIGVLTFGLYLLTVRPDVGGPEDSPKFQFVGYVLGTAHTPGYPFYTLLTKVFSWLPFGDPQQASGLSDRAALSLSPALL